MISILMPIYNGVEFLGDSLSSILGQTSAEWELLIGINGYPAKSLVYQTVAAYLAIINDPRIRLLDFPECKGKAATLNKMVPLCQSAYVSILDVDDIWLPTKLETQLPFISQTENYDVVGTKCFYFGELNSNGPNIPTGNISAFNFLEGNPMINSSALIKRELAYWNPAWDGVEDYDLWLRLRKEGRRFYNCNNLLVKHRIHRTSAFNAKGNHNQVASLKWEYKV
jgi:teichuronic acid biosynthesis glycosyltransferase TuaG